MNVQITDTQTVKVENGDILLVSVQSHASVEQVARLTTKIENQIRQSLGVEAMVLVVSVDGLTIGVVKRNELNDIYQRLSDLEQIVIR